MLKTEDYAILNKSIFVSLLAIEESGRMANFTLMVSYDTKGPWIDEPILAPNITCSPLDSTWRLEMPLPALSDELLIDTELIQGDQFSNLFSFSNSTRNTVLKAEKLSELTQGKDCPEEGFYPLSFKMSSVVLGTSIQKVDVGVSPIDLTQ